MYNPKEGYTTPVKRFNLNDDNHYQLSASNQQETKYRTHEHLHRNIYLYAVSDTPSTLHTTKAVTCINQNKQVVGKPLRPSLKEGIAQSYQRHARTNSKILSIRELKQQKARMHSRAASESSVKSSTNRKLFVTISKTNGHLGQQKGVMLNSEQAIRDLEQKSKRIKLTKYLQLRSAQKTFLQ